MKDDTIKLKLNINIFDYNKKCKRYDAIGNKDSNGHHSSLIYSDKTNIYIMHIQSDCLEYITSIYFYPRCHLSIQYVVITRRQSSTSKSKTVTVSITLNWCLTRLLNLITQEYLVVQSMSSIWHTTSNGNITTDLLHKTSRLLRTKSMTQLHHPHS